MTDITDSALYKKNIKGDVLSFNFSTDEAQLFKSSNKAFWPLQLHFNFLYGKARFQFPVLVALWQTEIEPTPDFMNLYMSVLKKNCDDLLSKGVRYTDHETGILKTLKLVPFCGCVDSVARPILQNRLQFNGHWGCSWCYHYGFYFARSMRYPLFEKQHEKPDDNHDPDLRSHESHLHDLSVTKLFPKKFYHGVKGPKLLEFQNIDIVWSLPVDYMHGALMGVTKQLYMSWKEDLTKKDMNKLNNRMSKIKLSKCFHRNLRTLKYAAKFKAFEWELWSLFVSVVCVKGILKEEK